MPFDEYNNGIESIEKKENYGFISLKNKEKIQDSFDSDFNPEVDSSFKELVVSNHVGTKKDATVQPILSEIQKLSPPTSEAISSVPSEASHFAERKQKEIQTPSFSKQKKTPRADVSAVTSTEGEKQQAEEIETIFISSDDQSESPEDTSKEPLFLFLPETLASSATKQQNFILTSPVQTNRMKEASSTEMLEVDYTVLEALEIESHPSTTPTKTDQILDTSLPIPTQISSSEKEIETILPALILQQSPASATAPHLSTAATAPSGGINTAAAIQTAQPTTAEASPQNLIELPIQKTPAEIKIIMSPPLAAAATILPSSSAGALNPSVEPIELPLIENKEAVPSSGKQKKTTAASGISAETPLLSGAITLPRQEKLTEVTFDKDELTDDDEPLILEPYVQGYPGTEDIYVYRRDGRNFISLSQLGSIVGFNVRDGEKLTGFFATEKRSYEIDFQKMEATFDGKKVVFDTLDVREIDGLIYFNISFYEKLFPFTLKIDSLNMWLIVNSNEKLPWTIKEEAKRKRNRAFNTTEIETFKDYEFDKRKISLPVIDFTYTKSYAKTDIGGANETTTINDLYGLNVAMLAGGLDTNLYLFGDTYRDDLSPKMRLTAGKTFLEEPRNKLNIVRFEMGDVLGYDGSLFVGSESGRGIMARSYKDLVMSSDKTIDINGPLSDGWEVELYLNNQLIGFRKSGTAGRYEFEKMPVSYGLNTFKLVFYGPSGEIRTEEKRYYSGTSPVEKGEFGYSFNLYQPERFLIEDNEPFVPQSNNFILNSINYYGISDNLTAIAGYTAAPDAEDEDKLRHFGTAGAQLIFDGASFQYNMMYDLQNNEVGHHFGLEGNVYIGDAFIRYEDFGKLNSPLSYQNGRYLKNLFEGRLSGILSVIGLPYSFTYLEANDNNDKNDKTFSVRISPNFKRYYNLTLESTWQDSFINNNVITNDILMMFNAFYEKLGLRAHVSYRTRPSDHLKEFGLKGDYRWDKNTYFSASWKHDFRSKYTLNSDDLDTFTIGGSRIFPFGGLNLDMSVTTDKDLTVTLRYNISLGQKPGTTDFFTNSETKLSDTGTIFARAVDENGAALDNIGISVNGLEKTYFTDKEGEVLITDLQTYQKTIINIDPAGSQDVSIAPVFDQQKRVLRPGTVYSLVIPFIHKGAIEGQLTQKAAHPILIGYKIEAINTKGESVMETYSDREGLFILDDIPFGEYDIVISRNEEEVTRVKKINIDDSFHYIQSIEVPAIRRKTSLEKLLKETSKKDDDEDENQTHLPTTEEVPTRRLGNYDSED